MKKKKKIRLSVGICALFAFLVWTVLVCVIDTQPIGPNGTEVGFASFNRSVHAIMGVNMTLYTVTDILGIIPIASVLAFASLGAWQIIKRKSLFKVDRNILILGTFYFALFAVYAFFEIFVINYRPILIEGALEASYPSSTTMLVTCVMPTVESELCRKIKNASVRRTVSALIFLFISFTVAARLASGVHWITDILGGLLFSIGFVSLYKSFCE